MIEIINDISRYFTDNNYTDLSISSVKPIIVSKGDIIENEGSCL